LVSGCGTPLVVGKLALTMAHLLRLLKNVRFVSGHRFSEAVTAAKSRPPSGGAFEL
jgi:hypothetical protein